MGFNDANIRRFETDLAEAAKELNVAISTVVIKIALDLHAKLSRRTPVDTGRARASWDIKEGSPSPYVPPEGTYQGPKPQSADALTGEDIVFVTSAVEYMEFLNQGSSKQAPANFIEIAIAELEIELEAIVARIRNS
jgi:hypothetical protein